MVDRIARLRAEGLRLAELAEFAVLDRPVPSCPEWTVAELLRHVGEVHRWATIAIETVKQPDDAVIASLMPGDEDELSPWLAAGVDALVTALETRDPQAPTWHFFPAPMNVGFWARRQLHETVIHRWDGEQALKAPTPIDTATAVDGIDEFLRVIFSRRFDRDGAVRPSAGLHVQCTNAEADWVVRDDVRGLTVVGRQEQAEVTLKGPAESILLALWGRADPAAEDIEAIGDPGLLAEWETAG